MFANRILEFGNKFKGRLDALWLESALDYIDYNEEGLAFDTLYTYLSEYDICLSKEEYDEMIKLAKDMGFDLNCRSFKYLKYLSRRGRK